MLLKASESKTLAPFAAYARVLPPPVGPGGTSTPVPTLALSLYFPHSDQPSKPLRTLVRKVSTVEEVVGLGLFLFGKEGRKPALEDGLDEEGSREWEIKLSTRGWGLRIVEDDGEVDEDFPGTSKSCTARQVCSILTPSRSRRSTALDRDASVAKFSFLEFAITQATPTQSTRFARDFCSTSLLLTDGIRFPCAPQSNKTSPRTLCQSDQRQSLGRPIHRSRRHRARSASGRALSRTAASKRRALFSDPALPLASLSCSRSTSAPAARASRRPLACTCLMRVTWVWRPFHALT
jgi:hypothetical protein